MFGLEQELGFLHIQGMKELQSSEGQSIFKMRPWPLEKVSSFSQLLFLKLFTVNECLCSFQRDSLASSSV